MLTEMAIEQKVMCEIYRESSYDRLFRVVYFTELDEHHRDEEINRALAGEHYWDGFLFESRLAPAKQVILGLLSRLNQGELVTADDVSTALAEFSA